MDEEKRTEMRKRAMACFGESRKRLAEKNRGKRFHKKNSFKKITSNKKLPQFTASSGSLVVKVMAFHLVRCIGSNLDKV